MLSVHKRRSNVLGWLSNGFERGGDTRSDRHRQQPGGSARSRRFLRFGAIFCSTRAGSVCSPRSFKHQFLPRKRATQLVWTTPSHRATRKSLAGPLSGVHERRGAGLAALCALCPASEAPARRAPRVEIKLLLLCESMPCKELGASKLS